MPNLKEQSLVFIEKFESINVADAVEDLDFPGIDVYVLGHFEYFEIRSLVKMRWLHAIT